MLEIKGLHKSYENFPVIKNVSFSCKAGSFHTIIGPSGAGKTTLLKLVSGILPADAGTLVLDDELLEPQDNQLVPGYEEIKVVHQDFQLKANMTVLENLNYSLIGFDPTYKKSRIEELIKTCHLQNFVEKEPYQLSGGQKQRVAIARALATEPAVILMDEPFSNLDPITKNQLLQESREIAHTTETTIVLVTHDTRDALEAADFLHVLIDGSISQSGVPASVYTKPKSPQIANLMGYMNYLTEDQHLLGCWAEHIEISASGKYSAEVNRKIFKGSYQLLSLSSALSPNDLLAFDFKKKYQKGDRINFDIDSKYLVDFGALKNWEQWLLDQ